MRPGETHWITRRALTRGLLLRLALRDLVGVKIVGEQAFLEEKFENSQPVSNLLFAKFRLGHDVCSRGGVGSGKRIGADYGIRCGERLARCRGIGRGERGARERNAFGWRLVRGIKHQGLELFSGDKLPPQKSLHPVFGRHGLVDQLLFPNFRRAEDREADRFLGRNQVGLHIESRNGLRGRQCDSGSREVRRRVRQ